MKLFFTFQFGCILPNANKKGSKSLLIARFSARKCSFPFLLFSLPCMRQKPSLYQTVAEEAVIQTSYIMKYLLYQKEYGKEPIQLSYLHYVNFYNPKLCSEWRF